MNAGPLACLGLVALGGAIGAVLRYGLAQIIGPYDGISWSTFLVNFLGCFLICFIFFKYADMSENLRLFLFIGLFGAFTTMSSVSLEMVTSFVDGNVWGTFLIFILNAVVCLGAGFLGRGVALLM